METKYALNKEEFPAIIIGKLMTISGILERESNRLLLPFQLNYQQFSILFEIARAGMVQQKNMVNRLSLNRAHVSKTVKKLQAMGLIDIHPIAEDRRSALMSPTGKGRKLVDDCRAIFRQWNQEWFGRFNPDELQQILDSVDRLQKGFLGMYSK
jgi:DNA-binding MarR family transcriptional regulator